MSIAGLLTVIAAAVFAVAATHGCGPPCADDRCSLSASKPQVNRVDYTKKDSGSSSSAGSSSTGSAAPAGSGAVAMVGSGSAAPAGSAAPVGSGSAKPAGSGSAAPAGSGSAAPVAPPAPSTSGAVWERDPADGFKMTLISKSALGASTTIRIEQVKTPVKTPYVITLQVKPPGGSAAAEAAWNDCPSNKIVCDPGTKTHSTKKAGQVLVQAGVNWAITAVADDGKGTLVTWTNNLSREVLQLRLSK